MTYLPKDIMRQILFYLVEPIYDIAAWAESLVVDRFIHEYDFYSNPAAGNLRLDIHINHLHSLIANPGMIKIIERSDIMDIISRNTNFQIALFSNPAAIHIIEKKIQTNFTIDLPKRFLLSLCRNPAAMHIIERYESKLTVDCLDNICIYQPGAGELIFRNKHAITVWGWIKFFQHCDSLHHIKKLLPTAPFRSIKGLYANPLVFRLFDRDSIVSSVINHTERLLELCRNPLAHDIIHELIYRQPELFSICHWTLISENSEMVEIVADYINQTIQRGGINKSLNPLDHIIVKTLFTNRNFDRLIKKNPIFISLIDQYDGWSILAQNPCLFEENQIKTRSEVNKLLQRILRA